MASSCFLSFTAADRVVCDELARQIGSAGIKVYRYDPDKPWEDAVERMATAIAEEVGCLVSLRLGRPLTKYCQLEVDWASKCDIPCVFVDIVSPNFDGVIKAVRAAPATDIPFGAHERFEVTVTFFRTAAEELDKRPEDERGDDYGSSIAADLNWGAKSDNSGNYLLATVVLTVGAVACVVIAIVFVVLAATASKYFLIGVIASIAGCIHLLFKAREQLTEMSSIQRRRG